VKLLSDAGAPVTRRRFGIAAWWTLTFAGCGDACATAANRPPLTDGHLTVRPPATTAGRVTSLKSGPLGLGDVGRDGVLQVPAAAAEHAVPLLVFLHGATQSGAGMLRRIGPAAEAAGIAVLAPDSRDTTWDAIRGEFSHDVAFLNRAIQHVFDHLAVDPAHIAIGGFSDGASYALALAVANGDLFPRVVAFSPGFLIRTPPSGHPRFFVSHGTADQILPIERCGRVVVRQLRTQGYDVMFREFDGRHEIPPGVAGEALDWLVK